MNYDNRFWLRCVIISTFRHFGRSLRYLKNTSGYFYLCEKYSSDHRVTDKSTTISLYIYSSHHLRKTCSARTNSQRDSIDRRVDVPAYGRNGQSRPNGTGHGQGPTLNRGVRHERVATGVERVFAFPFPFVVRAANITRRGHRRLYTTEGSRERRRGRSEVLRVHGARDSLWRIVGGVLCGRR
jgi:hypothetical protein